MVCSVYIVIQYIYIYIYILYYYIYIYILLYIYIYIYSRDYLKKVSIKINVATGESNNRNEIGHRANNEIGVAIQSWL